MHDPMRTHYSTKLFALSLCLSLALNASLIAAPTINSITPCGLRIGGTTTVTIEGADLLPEPRVLLAIAVSKQTVQSGATPVRIEVELTVEEGAQPAIYLLRVGNETGISNAAAVGADHLLQAPWSQRADTLPVALSGVATDSCVVSTGFHGRKGQQFLAEVESLRLGSKLNPVLNLYDARHAQVAWSQNIAAIEGDARIQAVLPSDGDYTVELHDAVYRGASPGHFRLKLGEYFYADHVFPLGVQRGQSSDVEYLATNLPPGTKSTVQFSKSGAQPVPWTSVARPASGSPPAVLVSDHQVLVESSGNGAPVQELPSAPVGVSGRLRAPGEVDRYRLPVHAGEELRFDVLAQRVGSPLDGVLTLENAEGAQLATNDDRPGTIDPGMDFTVPAGLTSLGVVLRNLRSNGGDDHVYFLDISRRDQPDFTLGAFEDRVVVPKGGAALLRVHANRTGYNGPIKLSFPGGPMQLTTSGAEIPAGVNDALVTFKAEDGSPAQTLGSVLGEAAESSVGIQRFTNVPETAVTRHEPWLSREMAYAIAKPGPFTVAWDESISASGLPAGGALSAKVTVHRGEGVKGSVRLALLSTQVPPKKTVKVNNVDQVVDDVDRTLRVEGMPTIAADQTSADIKILVPADLPKIPYDLAIKAEMLADDNKTVTGTVSTEARRLSVAASP